MHARQKSPARQHSQQERQRTRFPMAARIVLLSAWMLAIFVFSATPGSASESQSDVFAIALRDHGIALPFETLTFIVRKSAHIFAYIVLGLLAFGVMAATPLEPIPRVIMSVAIAAAYATSDEIHQLFVPGRSGEVRDVIIDTTAATAAIIIAALATRKKLSARS